MNEYTFKILSSAKSGICHFFHYFWKNSPNPQTLMKKLSGNLILSLFITSIFFTSTFQSLASESMSSQQDSVPVQTASGQPVYVASRLTTARPVIDGKLNDDCWKKGTWAGNYHQFTPNEGAKPTYPTELNIQYDDKYLYVAFRAFDGQPEKMTRMAGVRDETVGDMVGLTLDSYHDFRTGFEFTVTSWGQKVDLVLFNPASWDFNWNAVWKVKTGVEDSAWVAEYEIPLSQLRYSNKDEQVWGMHTWRWISRISEESNWEKQSKIGPGMLYNFGELRGIHGLKKSRRLEILPYVLGDLKTMNAEAANPFTKNGRTWGANAGLDAKIGVSSNFTIDLTVNPDFGQVESDPSVMNLSAFETFYAEKRPFFLEGLTIFDYKFDDQSLFYSRRIGHAPSLTLQGNDSVFVKSPEKTTILSAMKFSGTTSNGLSIGLIQSITAEESAQIGDSKGNKSRQQVEPLTSYTVARIQKGYKEGNTVIGGMLTSVNRFINDRQLEFLSRNAYTGGLDILTHWKDKEFYLDARLIGSIIDGSTRSITALQESSARYFQRPGAAYLDFDTTRTMLSGYGGKFKIGKGAKGFWQYSTGLTWLSPGLELNDLGYMTYADEIKNQNNISYLINKPVSIFHTYTIGLEQFNMWNFNGMFLGSGANLSYYAEFKNNWSLNAEVIMHTGAKDPRFLRGGPSMMLPYGIITEGKVSTDLSKNVTGSFSFDYEGRGNNSATTYFAEPGLSVRPVQELKLGISAHIAENRDMLQYITTLDYLNDKRYIFGTIDQKTIGLTFRVDLNISPEFSIQYYGSPYISRGSYTDFKRITNPEAGKFTDRFAAVRPVNFFNESYGLDETGDMAVDYYIGNPDFNFHQFRSNLVAKWEYRLGSYIYLVWSSEKTGYTNTSDATYGESLKQLRKLFPNNVFLVKLNYWFSL